MFWLDFKPYEPHLPEMMRSDVRLLLERLRAQGYEELHSVYPEKLVFVPHPYNPPDTTVP